TQHVTLGVVNFTGGPGTAALSHFAFVPLGQSARSGTDQPYLATRPGPGCDKGTARWALMTPRYTQISCPAGGTVLTVEARRYGWLDFTPPGGIFPAGYQISVRANLRQMRRGCAVIGTRMVAADGVLDEVCPNGAWFI
ncbi:MAG TPA: hypothetical protein VEH31_14705, partial [Streptosporangiaceae bacterium]|nr:hypothetical protein [Streptosporangiaceae bacterium]